MGSKNKRLEGDIDNNDKDSRLSKKHRKDREEKGQLEGYGWYVHGPHSTVSTGEIWNSLIVEASTMLARPWAISNTLHEISPFPVPSLLWPLFPVEGNITPERQVPNIVSGVLLWGICSEIWTTNSQFADHHLGSQPAQSHTTSCHNWFVINNFSVILFWSLLIFFNRQVLWSSWSL